VDKLNQLSTTFSTKFKRFSTKKKADATGKQKRKNKKKPLQSQNKFINNTKDGKR